MDCPSHPDKSPSLTVSEKNGLILVHCFGGCAVQDVLAAIGLDLKNLFPDRPQYSKKNPHAVNAYDVLRCLRDEITIILIASADCVNQRQMSAASLSRVQLAHDRIHDAVDSVFRVGRYG